MADAQATFGPEFDARRRELGLSFEALARKANLSRTYLQDLAAGRRGERASMRVVELVAAALEVEPDYFSLWRAWAVLEHPKLIDQVYAKLVKPKT